MPEIIECPGCQRKLRMEESVIGQTVQCPSCQHAFTAAAPERSSAPRRRDDDLPTYRPLDDEPPPRPAVNKRSRRRYEEDDEDYPRPPRSRYVDDDRKPHRGVAVLVLGIISLVLFFTLPGLIMAIVSVSMGTTDLAAMNRGEMNASGRGQTKAGLICGIIALCLEALTLCACCGLGMMDKL